MMTINIACRQCAPNKVLSAISVRDDGFYQVVCPQGHATHLSLQQQLFEVLFDLGLFALVDGYPREAITSFTGALERFYKFYVELVCIKHGLTIEVFEKAWKTVSNLSERQFGTYVIAYLFEMNSEPFLLGRKHVELRNNVIHGGKIPTSEQAIAYGDAVLKVVQPVIRYLKDKYPEDVRKSVIRHYNEIRRLYPKESSKTNKYKSINTTISLSLSTTIPDLSVSKALNNIKRIGRSW